MAFDDVVFKDTDDVVFVDTDDVKFEPVVAQGRDILFSNQTKIYRMGNQTKIYKMGVF